MDEASSCSPDMWSPQTAFVLKFQKAYDSITTPRNGRFDFEAGGDFTKRFDIFVCNTKEERDVLYDMAGRISWVLADLCQVFPCPHAAKSVSDWFRIRASFSKFKDDPEVRRAELFFLETSGHLITSHDLHLLRRTHENMGRGDAQEGVGHRDVLLTIISLQRKYGIVDQSSV